MLYEHPAEFLPPGLPDILTVKQVADLFGVSDDTVRRAVSAGKLVGFRVGKRCLRIPRATVEAFVRGVIPGGGGR